ncbi:hypothetical protein BH10BAC4_BH10BAC4_18490 [soil metagenome]
MIISERPPFSSLLRIVLLVIVLGWMVVGQGVGILVGMAIYGQDFLFAMAKPTADKDVTFAILFSQGVGSVVGLVFVPWYYLKTSEGQNFNGFFNKENNWAALILVVFISVFAMLISLTPINEWNSNFEFPGWMSGFGNWARKMETTAEEILKAITGNMTSISFALTFIVVAIIPAVGEELVFRGLIQTEIIRGLKSPHVGILIASIFFSAIHLQFFGFLPRLVMGLFLGYLYYWSGNLLVSMLAHFCINGIQVVALYLSQKGIISINVEGNESQPLPVVVLSAFIAILGLYYLRNYFISRSTSAGGPV